MQQLLIASLLPIEPATTEDFRHMMMTSRRPTAVRSASMNGAASPNKPPYQVPSMREIVALPWNGWHVASLVLGLRGSSLGYKMAGFKVVWANEFIPAAQATLSTQSSYVLSRYQDIRQVQPEDI